MSNPFRLQNAVAPAYRPDDGSAMAGAIDKISGAIQQRRAREEEQRRWELERQRLLGKDAQYERQNDLNEQRMVAGETRALQKHELEISDRNQKQFTALRELAGQGRESEAEAFAASSKYVDPKSGKTRSLEYTRSDAGVDAKDFAGFMETMPIGMTAAPKTEKPDYSGFTGLFGKTNAKITTPDGQETEIDPSEGEAFKARQAQQQKERLMGLLGDPTLPPDLKRTIALQAGLTGAQATGAERAGVTNAEGREDSQQFQGEQGDKNRGLRVLLKGMGGKGKSSRDDRADKRLDLQTEGAARQLAKDVLGGFGFREVQAQNRKFNDMAAQVTSDPNAALDAVTAGSFVKMAQGGTGVISDNDMKQFWGMIGGVEDRSDQWISSVLSGKIAPEKRAKVAEAVQWLGARAGQNLSEVKDAMDYAFSTSPNLSSHKDQMVGTYFSSARKPKDGAAPKSDPSRRARLVEWANKNPNDPRAKAILQAK